MRLTTQQEQAARDAAGTVFYHASDLEHRRRLEAAFVMLARVLVGHLPEPETIDCDRCCNKDRCDDLSHHYRPECPYCKGTGRRPNPYFKKA